MAHIGRPCQYGTIHFGQDVSFFVDGWYSEIEPKIGEYCYACIAIPSELLLEIRDFARDAGLHGLMVNIQRNEERPRTVNFRSLKFPGIAFSASFGNSYPEFRFSPTLQEYGLSDDGRLSSAKYDSITIGFGEISLAEAITLQSFLTQLRTIAPEEREAARHYIAHVMENGVDDKPEYGTVCDNLIYVVNDVISFVMPPNFLTDVPHPFQSIAPPAAVPTKHLLNVLITCP